MEFIAAAVLGVLLGGLFVGLARILGRRREDALLAAGLVAAAFVYVGFELSFFYQSLNGGLGNLKTELLGVVLFAGIAALGVWVSPWFLALGWAGHLLWDVAHLRTSDLAGLSSPFPSWYPPLCVGFDLLVATYVALSSRRRPVPP